MDERDHPSGLAKAGPRTLDRRVPERTVLQIGVDIYCDTRLILRELEARAPDPTLYPEEGLRGVANAISAWAEGQLFRPVMLYAWGTNHDVMPKELFVDRAGMRGLPVPSVDSVTRAAARNAPLMRIQLPLIEEMRLNGAPFVYKTANFLAGLRASAHDALIRITFIMEYIPRFGIF